MRVGRTAMGCLVGVAALIGLMLLVREAIFTVGPPRDDSRVAIGTATEFADAPGRVEVVLSRSYGLDGERSLDDGGLRQLAVIASGDPIVGISVVSGASPVEADCDVEIGPDRLVDCAGRDWTFEGVPIDPELPPLQRFAAHVETGAVTADLTRPLGGSGE
jgi:hypothetical protein